MPELPPVEETPNEPAIDPSTALKVLAAGGGLATAAQFAHHGGTRVFNLDATPHVRVLGGPQPYIASNNTSKDSFSSQAHALIKALKEQGLNVDHDPWPTSGKDAKGIARTVVRQAASPPDYDAVIGVGHEFGRPAIVDAGKVKIRLNTDFDSGNFVNTRKIYDTAGQDAMAVRGDKKRFHRYWTPGKDEHYTMPEEHTGKLPSMRVGNIPVSDAFNTPYTVKDWSPAARKKAFFTMGGGNAAPMVFDELAVAGTEDLPATMADKLLRRPGAKNYATRRYDVSKRFFLDDVVEAMRAKHGNNFELDALLGSTWDKNPMQMRGMRSDNFFKELQDYIATPEGKARFSGVNFIDRIPQGEVARKFADSHYVMTVPGSTVGELMHMPGEEVGKIINVLPNTNRDLFMKHFEGNASNVTHEIPSAVTWDTAHADRRKHFEQLLEHENPRIQGRGVGYNFDVADAAKTLRSDVRHQKIKNLKVMAATGGLAVGSYLISKVMDKLKEHKQKKEQPMSMLEKLSKDLTQPVQGFTPASSRQPAPGTAPKVVIPGVPETLPPPPKINTAIKTQPIIPKQPGTIPKKTQPLPRPAFTTPAPKNAAPIIPGQPHPLISGPSAGGAVAPQPAQPVTPRSSRPGRFAGNVGKSLIGLGVATDVYNGDLVAAGSGAATMSSGVLPAVHLTSAARLVDAARYGEVPQYLQEQVDSRANGSVAGNIWRGAIDPVGSITGLLTANQQRIAQDIENSSNANAERALEAQLAVASNRKKEQRLQFEQDYSQDPRAQAGGDMKSYISSRFNAQRQAQQQQVTDQRTQSLEEKYRAQVAQEAQNAKDNEARLAAESAGILKGSSEKVAGVFRRASGITDDRSSDWCNKNDLIYLKNYTKYAFLSEDEYINLPVDPAGPKTLQEFCKVAGKKVDELAKVRRKLKIG